jgi:hypothetical protein
MMVNTPVMIGSGMVVSCSRQHVRQVFHGQRQPIECGHGVARFTLSRIASSIASFSVESRHRGFGSRRREVGEGREARRSRAAASVFAIFALRGLREPSWLRDPNTVVISPAIIEGRNPDIFGVIPTHLGVGNRNHYANRYIFCLIIAFEDHRNAWRQ